MMSKDNSFKVHSMKYNLIMNMILKMSGFIFPLITFPYVSRVLLSEGTGKVAFAQSVISYLSLVASLGIPAYGVRQCAQVRDDKEKLTQCVKELLIINMFCTVCAYIAFIILTFTVPRFAEERTLLLIMSSTIILGTFGVEWFYQSIEQYDYITFRNLGFKVLSIILMFIFVKDQQDYIIYGGITVLGSVGSNFINFIRLRKFLNLKKHYQYNIKKHLTPIFTLFLYYAATTIYTNLDMVMLGFISGDQETGYYNAAVKLKSVLVGAITAIGSVALPRASTYLAKHQVSEFNRLINLSSNLIIFFAFPFCAYFVINADNVIRLLSGEDFINAVPAMRIITPTIIFIGITSITAYQLLIPLGDNKTTLVGAIIGAIADFVLNFLLIPTIGAAGASVGTLAAEFLVLITHFTKLKEYIPFIIDKKQILRVFCSTFIASALLLILHHISFASVILEIFVSGMIFFFVYFLMNLLLKTDILIYILGELKRKF